MTTRHLVDPELLPLLEILPTLALDMSNLAELREQVGARMPPAEVNSVAVNVHSIAGPDGYITPNWYIEPAGSVPTWNYVSAEIDGTARLLDEESLINQLDVLASLHEPRVAPDRPWTRDKMPEERFRAMLKAITGFEVTIEAIRGTTKLSQNKNDAEVARVIAGLRDTGNPDLAAATEATR